MWSHAAHGLGSSHEAIRMRRRPRASDTRGAHLRFQHLLEHQILIGEQPRVAVGLLVSLPWVQAANGSQGTTDAERSNRQHDEFVVEI